MKDKHIKAMKWLEAARDSGDPMRVVALYFTGNTDVRFCMRTGAFKLTDGEVQIVNSLQRFWRDRQIEVKHLDFAEFTEAVKRAIEAERFEAELHQIIREGLLAKLREPA